MINDNPIMENVKYNIDMTSIHKIKPELIELQNMIGMKNLKDSVLDQILYFSQNLHKNKNNIDNFVWTYMERVEEEGRPVGRVRGACRIENRNRSHLNNKQY